MLKCVSLKNFTVFRENQINFSPNINVFIGKNSTGKSLLMKILYSTIPQFSPSVSTERRKVKKI